MRITNITLTYFFGAALLVIVTASCAAVDAAPLPNKGQIIYQQNFEQVSSGQLPPFVADDSGWAGASVPMQVINSGDGRYHHVLQCQVSGFAQLRLGKIHLQKGQVYRVSLIMATGGQQQVQVYLRHGGRPYTMYMSATVHPNEAMQSFSLMGKATATTDDAILFIKMHGRTILKIDDIKITKMATDKLPQGAPPTPGNRVLNSGFELGRDGWYLRGPAQVEQNKNAFEGNCVAKLGAGGLLSSAWMPLSYESNYQVCVRLKAIGKAANVRIGMSNYLFKRGASGGHTMSIHLAPKDGWQIARFVWRPSPQAGQFQKYTDYYLTIHCMGLKSDDGGAVLVDAAQVQAQIGLHSPNILPVYAPRAKIERALGTNTPENVFTQGEPVKMWVRTTGPDRSFEITIKNEQGKLFRTLKVTAKQNRSVVQLDKLPCGYWHIQTKNSTPVKGASSASIVQGETFVTVVPKMPSVSLSRWPFGAHIPANPTIREACWKLGLRWNRLHDTNIITKWPQVEPSEGVWTFHDKTMKAMRSDGEEILGLLDRVPAWARDKAHLKSRDVPGTLSGEELAQWQNYVYKVTAHWRDRVAAWEVMNEPWNHLSALDYINILKATAPMIRRGDPDAIVVGLGGPLLDSSWLKKAIALGAGRYCDAISFHGYGISLWSVSGGPEPLIRAVNVARHNLAKAGTPNVAIWNTEAGIKVNSHWTKFATPQVAAAPLAAARMMPKSVAASLAAGVARTFYYAAFPDDAPDRASSFGWIIGMNGVVRMPTQPIAVAIALLAGRRYVGAQHINGSPNVVDLKFQGRGATVYMLWSDKKQVTITAPAGTQKVLNMWGRAMPMTGKLSLGPAPVYAIVPR